MRRQSGDEGRNALSERIWKLAREAQQPLQFVSFCRGRSLYLVSDDLVSDVIFRITRKKLKTLAFWQFEKKRALRYNKKYVLVSFKLPI